jgi:hypothetical protein
MSGRRRPGFAFALALLLPAAVAAGDTAYAPPELLALVVDPRVDEISGLAASRRHDGVLWAVNDSDQGSRVYALGLDGKVLGSFVVAHTRNTDWEDLAAFERGGKSYLAIADTGDNGGLREELAVVVVAEPELVDGAPPKRVAPAWTVRFRYPDGPRDCESVAVDARTGEIWLMAKKRVPAQLFTVPLARPRHGEVRTARQIATVRHIPQPTPEELAKHPQFGRYRGQITGMDLDPAGRRLAVLTYRDAYVFERRGDATWPEALLEEPTVLGVPVLPQGESIAFGRDGKTIYVTSERLPAPLIRVERK